MNRIQKRDIVKRDIAKRSGTSRRDSSEIRRPAKESLLLAFLVVLCLAALFVMKSGNIASAAEGTEDVEYKYYTTITVEKGETLWDLALENYSEKYYDSVEDYIDEVKSINGMKSDTIHEGAKLVIIYFSSEYR